MLTPGKPGVFLLKYVVNICIIWVVISKGRTNMGKVKKPILKRWWFWLIIIVVVIAIGSSMANDNKTATGQADNKNS